MCGPDRPLWKNMYFQTQMRCVSKGPGGRVKLRYSVLETIYLIIVCCLYEVACSCSSRCGGQEYSCGTATTVHRPQGSSLTGVSAQHVIVTHLLGRCPSPPKYGHLGFTCGGCHGGGRLAPESEPGGGASRGCVHLLNIFP